LHFDQRVEGVVDDQVELCVEQLVLVGLGLEGLELLQGQLADVVDHEGGLNSINCTNSWKSTSF
jgi:hypothetical protein